MGETNPTQQRVLMQFRADVLHEHHNYDIIILCHHKHGLGDTLTCYGTEGAGLAFIGNKGDQPATEHGEMVKLMFRKFMQENKGRTASEAPSSSYSATSVNPLSFSPQPTSPISPYSPQPTTAPILPTTTSPTTTQASPESPATATESPPTTPASPSSARTSTTGTSLATASPTATVPVTALTSASASPTPPTSTTASPTATVRVTALTSPTATTATTSACPSPTPTTSVTAPTSATASPTARTLVGTTPSATAPVKAPTSATATASPTATATAPPSATARTFVGTTAVSVSELSQENTVLYKTGSGFVAAGILQPERQVLHGQTIPPDHMCVLLNAVRADVTAPLILGDKEENRFLEKGKFFALPKKSLVKVITVKTV